MIHCIYWGSQVIFPKKYLSSNNVVCATSKVSDQPAHTRSLIRAFASRLSILWLLHHLELKRLVGVYICQNVKLLEISCGGLIFISFSEYRFCLFQTVQTLMKWCIKRHFIWVSVVCQIPISGFLVHKRVIVHFLKFLLPHTFNILASPCSSKDLKSEALLSILSPFRNKFSWKS